MEEVLSRMVENVFGRVEGPLTFRLLLQPIMATFFAIRDGRRDARNRKVPYLWSVFTDPEHRRELLRDGWKSVGRVFLLAVGIDGLYQFIVFRWFYPAEALIVAIVLAFVPYVLIRGPVTRLVRS